jgi:FMN phosphatase YigB (HAD superfamily)
MAAAARRGLICRLLACRRAPPELAELRELVRYRAKLTALSTSAKAKVHAVVAKLGILPTFDDHVSRD